jgi:hypothetical protein
VAITERSNSRNADIEFTVLAKDPVPDALGFLGDALKHLRIATTCASLLERYFEHLADFPRISIFHNWILEKRN